MSVNAADPGKKAPGGRDHDGRCFVACAGAGEDVILAFPWDAAMVAEAKAIGGRRFDWDTRTNVYPYTRLAQVVAFADAHGIDVARQVRALVIMADGIAGQRGAGLAGQATREAAHLYLSYGLLPVPAWAARADGACRCSRGTACPRPGKHPRSVPTGPGAHDYSWKPLACRTHEDIEQRFAIGGRYADANLMVAIPRGMLVIDQDFDDGGRRALASLAGRFGELPATLGHATPHGTHRIYRTPPGWTTRAWVGKDARNPLPAGIDLRVPGQVLMAPPSRVPDLQGMARYGPVTGVGVADLPAAYVTEWTPPREAAPATWKRLPLLPGRADVAASYVNARITGIAEDLAAIRPGGRNTAIYTAALRVGSTLGAARSLPGAEEAASAWTDEAAESALLAAAEQNGYIADHSASAARSAIRSGLRNGLRQPRPLPGLTGGGAYRVPVRQECRPAAASAIGREAVPEAVADRAETGEPATVPPGHRQPNSPGDWRNAILGRDRDNRHPGSKMPGLAAEAREADVG